MAESHLSTSRAKAKSGVYAIRCTPAGRVYVGSAVNIGKRWWEHRRDLAKGQHCNCLLQRAWDKYGVDAFAWEVVEFVAIGDLIATEQKYIDEYSASRRKTGFNLSPRAGSSLGVKHTDEARARMSVAHKGRVVTEETRAKLSAAGKGRRITAGQLSALRESHLGKTLTDDHKEKLSRAFKGRKFTDEHRAKIAQSLTGRVVTEETREKFRNNRHSEETKAKLRGRKFTDEHRARISAARQAACNSPEGRARMAAIRRQTCIPKGNLGSGTQGRLFD